MAGSMGLAMNRFHDSPHPPARHRAGGNHPQPGVAAAAAGRPPPLYELVAVADHTGCINGGHYTARGRCLLDGCWAEFNDSLVLATDAPSGSTREAYFLLYRLVG